MKRRKLLQTSLTGITAISSGITEINISYKKTYARNFTLQGNVCAKDEILSRSGEIGLGFGHPLGAVN